MIQSVVSPTVVCRQLTKSYNSPAGSVRVVRGIDLSVAPQTLTMLVGPSGCGKTTLLSLVAGILEPTFGSVSVLKKRLDRLTDRQRTLFRRQFIGLVVQENNLLPTLTAAENVAVTLAIAGWSKRLALEKAYEILDRFDLSSHRHSLPRELSGGQQQRVAIARAVVHEPQVLICDEPTSALDHQTGQTILKLLKRIARDPGRSVLMVTHDTRTFSFADRILRMHDGRIQEDQS